MANVNKVILIGNLTRDPELRYLPSQMAVCDVGLAVNRTFKNAKGEKQEEVTFVDVTFWAKAAELIKQYMTKGKPIYIEGRLKYDTWEGKDGTKKSKLTVVAEEFQFLGGRSESGAPSGNSRPAAAGAGRVAEDFAPTGASYGAAESGQAFPAEDDIPF